MIKLYGNLIKKFGKEISCKVNSVNELMKACEANRPGFRNAIERDRGYVIRRGDSFKTAIDVGEDEVDMNFSETTWHVLPVPAGSGKWGKIILGVVLVVVGVVLNCYGQSWLGGPLIKIGIGLMVGGVADLLAPSPDVLKYSDRNDPDKRPSYLFNGPLNRTEAGGAVPLIYGKDVFVGSIFVSGGLTVGDIT